MSASPVEEALRHPALQRLQERLAHRVPLEAVAPTAREAAVAAVFRVVPQGPELLFIKRAEHEGDPWSGHMAFPGGRRDAEDASLESTVVRETREELALDLRQGQLLGRVDDLAPLSPALPPILIRPFVAVVAADVTFVQSHEVAATFWVPVSALQHPESQAEHVMTINGAPARFPGFRVAEHIVWGLTDRILRQVLTLLAP